MLNSKLLIGSAVAAVTSLAASGAFAGPAAQPDFTFEKCYGIARAAADAHDCAERRHNDELPGARLVDAPADEEQWRVPYK